MAKFADAVFVLLCFQKKTQQASKVDLDLAESRYREWTKELKKMSNERFTSAWDAVEDTPEDAENMKLRSTLMIALKQLLTRTGISQA